MNRTLLIFLIPALTVCNIWDNIFSKPRGIPTIIFKDQFSATFNTTQNQTQYKVKIDYNLKQLRANAILYTQLNVLLSNMEIEVAQIEVNFNKNLLIVTTPFSCNNYELGYNFSLPQDGLSSKVMGSYLQVLFEFIKKQTNNYIFKFSPNLINSLQEDRIPNVNIYTDENGQILKIKMNEQDIVYQWKSTVKKLNCKRPVQKLKDNKDLTKMIDVLRG